MKSAPVKPVKKSANKTPLIVIGVVAVVAVIAGGIAIAGHKSSMSGDMKMTTGATTSNAVATNTVSIANYAFSPTAITVKAGTTVTWTNTDAVQHTVTIDSGSAPMSQLFGRGQTYSYTFTKAGTYTYHCTPHPYMKATVVVTN